MPEATLKPDHHGVHPLDTLVWQALTGKQRRFAVGNERVTRFHPDIAPFAAMADTTPASFDALREVLARYGQAALATPDPIELPADLAVIRRAILVQMIYEREPEPVALDTVRLGTDDVPAMLALTGLAQPGPFGPRTVELGDYLGVRRNGVLAAMAGERLAIEGYTEISAVCVDPAFRGQGLATSLMTQLIRAIRARGETPFLHVLSSNHGAISVYRALGFVERRDIHLTVLAGTPG